MLTQDGTPLKAAAKALRREKLRALALIAPPAVLRSDHLCRADRRHAVPFGGKRHRVAETLPQDRQAPADWDYEGGNSGRSPDEDVFAALYMTTSARRGREKMPRPRLGHPASTIENPAFPACSARPAGASSAWKTAGHLQEAVHRRRRQVIGFDVEHLAAPSSGSRHLHAGYFLNAVDAQRTPPASS
jgi:putative spermidine/putrescine transport system permease protein